MLVYLNINVPIVASCRIVNVNTITTSIPSFFGTIRIQDTDHLIGLVQMRQLFVKNIRTCKTTL